MTQFVSLGTWKSLLPVLSGSGKLPLYLEPPGENYASVLTQIKGRFVDLSKLSSGAQHNLRNTANRGRLPFINNKIVESSSMS
jgi:hypothetical protein